MVVQVSHDLPPDYLDGIHDGMVVSAHELDVLSDHPTRPAIALPTDRFVERGGRLLPVYEIHPLGPA